MADNDTLITPATGPTAIPIASDDIDGIRHQRMKMEFGVDGEAVDVSGDDPLPVYLGGGDVNTVVISVPTIYLTGTGVAVDDEPIAMVDVLGYTMASVEIQPQDPDFDGLVAFEMSNSGANWFPCPMKGPDASQGAGWEWAQPGIYIGAVRSRYFRCRISQAGTGDPVWINAVFSAAGTPDQIALMLSGENRTGVPVAGSPNDGASFVPVRTDGDGNLTVVADQPINVYRYGPNMSALSSVAGSATSVLLLATNGNRQGASIYNDSTAVLYVAWNATASTTAFTALLAPGDLYELPDPAWTGDISGIWASATGYARVTEVI